MNSCARSFLLLAWTAAVGCHGDGGTGASGLPTTVTPEGQALGTGRISFVGSTPVPGSTISLGCMPPNCGRLPLRMIFSVVHEAGATTAELNVKLIDAQGRLCAFALGPPPFDLPAGVQTSVVVDNVDFNRDRGGCDLPVTTTSMIVQVGTRSGTLFQSFRGGYRLVP